MKKNKAKKAKSSKDKPKKRVSRKAFEKELEKLQAELCRVQDSEHVRQQEEVLVGGEPGEIQARPAVEDPIARLRDCDDLAKKEFLFAARRVALVGGPRRGSYADRQRDDRRPPCG